MTDFEKWWELVQESVDCSKEDAKNIWLDAQNAAHKAHAISIAEQANVMRNQHKIINRLRDERDALLGAAGVLVDYDFGYNGWNPTVDGAAMRLRILVTKMREEYDA